MRKNPVRYEYAGFLFDIWLDQQGKAENAVPVRGQHPASNRDKHRRAAMEMYNQDHPQ